jgi:hypothetical protein
MKQFFVLVAVLFVTGCITGGEKFTKLESNQLVLGETTSTKVRELVGRPFQMGSTDKHGRRFETMAFAFSDPSEEAATDDIAAPARSQVYYFTEDKLVGFTFTSSYASDSTNFDSNLVEQIKPGATTKKEVEYLFGKPGGEQVYPFVENKGERAIIYRYAYVSGGLFNLRASEKVLTVYFNDETNIVTNVEFESVGDR